MTSGKGVWVAALLSVLVAGCSKEKPEGGAARCVPECLPWEQCQDGVCVGEPIDLTEPLELGPAELPVGRVGVRYEQALAVAGIAEAVTFLLDQGDLPAGLTLDSVGMLSGLPVVAGSWSFWIDAVSGERSGSREFTLRIEPALLSFHDARLPDAAVGNSYQAALTASGGTPPYQFTFLSGDQIDGLAFSSDGRLFGVPRQAGTFAAQLEVTDSSAVPQRAAARISLAVLPLLTITPATLPEATLGARYSVQLATAENPAARLRFALAFGSLPAGLGFDATGLLAGTPVRSGSYPLTVQVSEAGSGRTSLTHYQLLVATVPVGLPQQRLPEAMVGRWFAAQLSAQGGTPPFSFELDGGALPSGLTLADDGRLAGTPLESGLFGLRVRVRDSALEPQEAVAAVQLRVLDELQLSGPLPDAMVGSPYAGRLAATGGTGPYLFELVSGELPAGLALDALGEIAGIPERPGSSLFTVRVVDSSQPSWDAVEAAELTVLPPTLLLAGEPLPEGLVGREYSAALHASGGVPPFGFSILSGALPPGVTLGSDGALGGIPEAEGNFEFVAEVRDAAGQRVAGTFAIAVTSRLELATRELAMGTLGQPYAATLEARGGVPPYSFRLVSGSVLPAGLVFDASGRISGTALSAGTSMLVIEVTDSGALRQSASGELALGISPDGVEAPLAIVTATLPPAALGQAYRASIDVTGGSRPYFLSLAFGSVLPAGLELSGSGTITGTPLHAGTYRVVVQADDSSNPAQLALRGYTLVVAPLSGEPLELTTNWLPEGDVGVPYRALLAARGGQPPYRFGISATSRLPAGLYVDASGQLLGTPLAAGRYTFTAAVWDASAPYQMATATLSLLVGSAIPGEAVLVLTGALRKAKVNVPYQQTLGATGGSGSYAWRVVWGMLPLGVTLSDDGVIAGTPLAQGTFAFAVEVQDRDSLVASQANLSLFVLATGPAGVRIMTPGFPDAEIGVFYDRGLMAIGGQAPYDFALSGHPPALTLQLDQATRRAALAGVPEVSGLFRMLVSATDASGTSGLYYEHMAVYPKTDGLLFSTSMLPDGKVGLPYALNLGATGGTAPYRFELSRGTALPELLTLSPDGVLVGVPQAAGTWTAIVKVTDAAGASAEAQFWVQILE